MTSKFLKTMGAATIAVLISSASVFAGPIADRIAAGESIRIGFANIPICAYLQTA